MADLADGLRLAVTTFTVVPARPATLSRSAAAVAMATGPALGAALGALIAATAGALVVGGAPPLLAGTVAVTLSALLTRGLHLDGLADSVDALGSYRRGDAALAIMKKSDVGPFGVAALVLTLLAQAACLAALAAPLAGPGADSGGWWSLVVGGAVALAAGRLSATWRCRRGTAAARPGGLGALVAGTVGPVGLALSGALVLLIAVAAVPGRPWHGPLAVLVALTATAAAQRRLTRRIGGVTGDVLGAGIELTTTLTLAGLTLAP
ncbi:adenosylcobinamide-GDP ribazoletransferase [Pilimelia columellifera]|uniref:Adenosylcobinamide-GDP ribazoletransferase n=1 Tax=Pilimelia columellifera subsp. columellifera TaxID=706583 RepID=A0ABN3NP62_9ACTN